MPERGWETLPELADAELAAARLGDWATVAERQKQREELLAALANIPLDDARPHIAHALAIQAHTEALLSQSVARARQESRQLDRLRSGVRGYAGGGPESRIDVAS